MAIKKREQKPLATATGGVKREFSAGGAVYKRVKRISKLDADALTQNVENYWLIIRPSGTKRWQLPKGNIEEGESAQETAVREVAEETGVQARVIEKIDTVRYFYVREGTRIAKSVTFFLMEYEDGSASVSKAAEHEIDAVEFMPADKVIARLTFRDDKEVVRKAEERLSKGVQESLV